MKRILMIAVLLALAISLMGFAPMSIDTGNGPQTYTVLVGWENVQQGVNLMSYFPAYLKVHAGDTVTWKANSHEIHTVTFLAGAELPELLIPAPAGMASPLQINPLAAFPAAPADGMYDGSIYANSGIMSTDPGQVPSFSLTFPQAGMYEYICIVHGMMQTGVVEVVDSGARIPSPAQVKSRAKMEILAQLSKLPRVMMKAMHQMVPPAHNPDGSTTWTVMVGYSDGPIDLMRFFPSRLAVRPGDTVFYKLSDANTAPHNIFFPNTGEEPGLVVPVPQPAGPPVLLFNPAILFPTQNVVNGEPLNAVDPFNSGLLVPGTPNTTFAIKIGDISGKLEFLCSLHDTSGMNGWLYVRK